MSNWGKMETRETLFPSQTHMSAGQYENSQSRRVTGKRVVSLDLCHGEILEVFRKFPRQCRDRIVATPKHTHLAGA